MTTLPGPPAEVRRFFDAAGLLKQWPAKRKIQLLVLAHLARLFELGRRYREREINALLRSAHSYEDWVSLRRALIDARMLDREGDGSAYWRVTSSTVEGAAAV
jgi:chloramphenicol O-acetyltransferase type A